MTNDGVKHTWLQTNNAEQKQAYPTASCCANFIIDATKLLN